MTRAHRFVSEICDARIRIDLPIASFNSSVRPRSNATSPSLLDGALRALRASLPSLRRRWCRA